MQRPFAAFISVALLVAACAAAPPPTPSPTLPPVVCDNSQWTPHPANLLRCDEAVAVAMHALLGTHPPITGIEFRWGDYCPQGDRCGPPTPARGFVIFTVSAAAEYYVQIEKGDSGRVTAVSPLTRIH